MDYMHPKLDWSKWFAVALPVSAISIVLIWLLLLVSYKPSRSPDGECDLEIKPIRPTRDPFTLKQYWVCFVCLATIGLWCFEHAIEQWVGDMGVIAIIPIVAFFSTGVLKKVIQLLGGMSDRVLTCPRMTSTSSCGRSYSSPWEELH